MPPVDSRLEQAHSWLREHLQHQPYSLSLLSGDASFRRYFRIQAEGKRYALMDAPPEQEDSLPFVVIGRHWRAQGINVPEIFADDLSKGFLLLEDFGDTTFLQQAEKAPDHYYHQAIDSLIGIQQVSPLNKPSDSSYPAFVMPAYSEQLIRREISLFTEWLLQKKLQLSLSPTESRDLNACFDALVSNAMAQPQVVVHRDYHSRNLMVTADQQLGVIDFQDAVTGPITYDLVSLLRDCYIKWPARQIKQWVSYYHQQLGEVNKQEYARDEFTRWFDLMGMQRHLKAAGIFARLSLRDGKHGYLDDIPRTVSYLVDVTADYVEFSAVRQWLNNKLVPALADLCTPSDQPTKLTGPHDPNELRRSR